jgi:hypothetical protein
VKSVHASESFAAEFHRYAALRPVNEVVFHPTYQAKRVVVIGCFLLGGIGLLDSLLGSGEPYWVIGGSAAFILGSLFMAAYTVKEIRFGAEITVERYFWPTRTHRYRDFRGVTEMGIRFGRWAIPFQHMNNVDELMETVEELAERGYIRHNQVIDEARIEKEVAAMWATLGAVAVLITDAILSWVFSVSLLDPFYPQGMSHELFSLLSFIAIVSLLYRAIRSLRVTINGTA